MFYDCEKFSFVCLKGSDVMRGGEVFEILVYVGSNTNICQLDVENFQYRGLKIQVFRCVIILFTNTVMVIMVLHNFLQDSIILLR